MSPPPALELRRVSKRFAGVRALQEVDLDLLPGEVHALVGENGAGKSTLVKILAGVHRPDEGEVRLRGEALVLHGPAEARGRGGRGGTLEREACHPEGCVRLLPTHAPTPTLPHGGREKERPRGDVQPVLPGGAGLGVALPP